MIQPVLPPNEADRLHALHETNQLDTPLEERFERITRLAQRLLNVPIAAISLVDADRQWFKSIQGSSMCETGRDVSFCGHAILSNEIFLVRDARIDPRFEDNPLVTDDPRVVFYAGIPVRSSDGSNIASLCIVDREPRELDSDDVQALRDLGALVESELASSLHCSTQRELLAQVDEANQKAKVDMLTRTWNRAAIFEHLHTKHAIAHRDNTPFATIMVDIDHFKNVNDTYGHAAGDEVLRIATKRMLSAIRQDDALGRYGGEEFMIVLGETSNYGDCVGIAERLRSYFESVPMQTEFGTIDVTASVGLAHCDCTFCDDEHRIVKLADEMMYKAKSNGRNRVESAKLLPCPPIRLDIQPDTKAA